MNESTVTMMNTPQYSSNPNGTTKYGLGWCIWGGKKIDGIQPHGHAGCGYGMTTYIGINESNDKAIIFFINKKFDFSDSIEFFVYFEIMKLLYHKKLVN